MDENVKNYKDYISKYVAISMKIGKVYIEDGLQFVNPRIDYNELFTAIMRDYSAKEFTSFEEKIIENYVFEFISIKKDKTHANLIVHKKNTRYFNVGK